MEEMSGVNWRVKMKGAVGEALVEAAEKVMIEKGFKEATMQEIAERAGCAPSTLYTHFKTKEELFRGIVRRRGAQLHRRMMAQIEESKGPLDKLQTIILVHLEWGFEEPELMNLFCTVMPMRFYEAMDSLNDIIPTEHGEFRNIRTEVVRELQAAGKLRKDFSAEVLGDAIDGILFTMMDQFVARPGRLDLREQVDLVWGMVMGGLGVKGKS